MDDQYNVHKASKQTELDSILDKINRVGYDKLSKQEKEKLNDLSK
ncbi:MAG: DUF6576 domain-containing protein [Bacteroidota bacterium]